MVPRVVGPALDRGWARPGYPKVVPSAMFVFPYLEQFAGLLLF